MASYQSRRDARAAVAEETTDKTPGCFSTRSSMSPRGGLDGRGASDAATASEAAMALGEWRERSRREARRPSAEEAREREQKRRRANREGGGNAARNARVARGIRPWPRARRTRALCTCGSATMARVARGGFISRIFPAGSVAVVLRALLCDIYFRAITSHDSIQFSRSHHRSRVSVREGNQLSLAISRVGVAAGRHSAPRDTRRARTLPSSRSSRRRVVPPRSVARASFRVVRVCPVSEKSSSPPTRDPRLGHAETIV